MKKVEIPSIQAITIGDDTVDVGTLLSAPFEDISEAAEKIPAVIGWLGYHRAAAMEKLINADFNRKREEASQYSLLKGGQFVALGFGDKVTETALERAVMLQPSVKEAHDNYARQKRRVDWFQSTIDALKAKMDLVRSSEVTRRMEHEP